MLLVIHQNSKHLLKVLHDGNKLELNSNSCTTVLWELSNKFPDELLCWVEEEFKETLNNDILKRVFNTDRIMASYSIKTEYFSDKIGYIDQLPFINVNKSVKYPTWQMSTDIGGINTSVLSNFHSELKDISDFAYLLNSIAKTGQQNGLFCYSDPALISFEKKYNPVATASTSELFSFVRQHYKSIWTFVLFYCFLKHEKRIPVIPLLKSLFQQSLFKTEVNLFETDQFKTDSYSGSIDVIIPTIGRPEYLLQVVEDLSKQSLLPENVIIVEQNPDLQSQSEILELTKRNWPFKMVHHFTHQTGACKARNTALKDVHSEWVFLADDDIRIASDILEKTINEANRLNVNCINLNCKQPGEPTIFNKIKQWGSFGSGTSIVKSKFAKNNLFSEVFEHGYGEDADYGMKLRLSGCDIIYHPDLVIRHLKAPMGGFRKKPTLDWEKEKPLPKPSPTIMIFAKRYYTEKEIKGYKVSLFLKSYNNQPIRNPFKYISQMRKRWKRSEIWSEQLLANASK